MHVLISCNKIEFDTTLYAYALPSRVETCSYALCTIRPHGTKSHMLVSKLHSEHRGKNALRMSTKLSFRSITRFQSNVNKLKSRTAKFENKKKELRKESGRKVCLVEKFILHLSFKSLHQGIWCLHQLEKMREFRTRSQFALDKSHFFPFHFIYLFISKTKQ